MEYSMPGGGVSEVRRKTRNIAIFIGVVSLIVGGLLTCIAFMADKIAAAADMPQETASLFATFIAVGAAAYGLWGILYILGGVSIFKFSKVWPIVLIVLASIQGVWSFMSLLRTVTVEKNIVSIALNLAFISMTIQVVVRCYQIRKEDARR
jgi:hypothetical protein